MTDLPLSLSINEARRVAVSQRAEEPDTIDVRCSFSRRAFPRRPLPPSRMEIGLSLVAYAATRPGLKIHDEEVPVVAEYREKLRAWRRDVSERIARFVAEQVERELP